MTIQTHRVIMAGTRLFIGDVAAPPPWEDNRSTPRSRRDHLVAANLTRDEARTRAESIIVDSYRVELDLTGGDTTFRSVSTIEFGCARPGTATFLNLAAPGVHAITLNGSPLSLDAFDGMRIPLGGLPGRNAPP